MEALSYLKDKDFLRALDNINNKFYWAKIEVLDSNENVIQAIEGRVQPGSSINISGNSSVRRTCNISFVADEKENYLTDVDNLLFVNRKIRLFEGIKNSINNYYNDIIWFPLGVYVIVDPNISHSSSGCIISLSCKDKMCLLNGECAGSLPTSITFHEYEQVIGRKVLSTNPLQDESLEPNDYTIYVYQGHYYSWSKKYGWEEEANDKAVGSTIKVPQLIYDIIQTLVCNYGGESLSKIFINDIPLELKQIVRYTRSNSLYYNSETGMYTTDEAYLTQEGTWRSFSYNEDVGYVYTDFTYPGTLISNIGDNICSVLDKIKNALGNYEYFYDVEGNFVFQEVKNYLNTSYDPTDEYRLDNNRKIAVASNGLSIIDDTNYEIDFYSNTKSVYTFSEGSGLISAISNSPKYTNLKNDFHIWGEDDQKKNAIHYHLVIKEKPTIMNEYSVVFLKDDQGNPTGGLRLAEEGEDGEEVKSYVPEDWRAELYLQGLTKKKMQQRPDIYEQELLDLFDSIYDFKAKKFKSDLVYNPNDLKYFFDYLEPISSLYDCSVDLLNTKIYSYKQDKVNKLYNIDVPNIIMIDLSMDEKSRDKIINRCEAEGQPYSNVDSNIYSKLAIGTSGYSAQEVARDLLYQYTNYNETITLQTIPIYYLDVNSRITVQDRSTGVYGDYIINSISIPMNAENTMSISASRALKRI